MLFPLGRLVGRWAVSLVLHPSSFILLLVSLTTAAGAAGPCRVEVVETGTGWPVPLVELRTIHHERFVSDNAGLIALDLPELMGRQTWFFVIGQGYEVPADGFGFRGVRLTPEPGRTLRVEVRRTIIARRMGRLTGAGLFAESQKLGLASPVEESGVLGCDTVQNAVYGGKLHWLWGDTNVPGYPLGIFDSTGAASKLNPLEALVPPVRLRLDYFTDDRGRPRGIAKMPGEGPTWVTGMTTLPDARGVEHMVAAYMKVRKPMSAWQWGLAQWNAATSSFAPLRVVWTEGKDAAKAPPMPEGHAVLWSDAAGQRWVSFGDPFPALRCRATFEAWQDAKNWEVLQRPEQLRSPEGEIVKPHRGAIAWSPYRRRWVTIFEQHGGRTSLLGEIWYAEADGPLGPWGPAVKVLSHDDYTFYNPQIHAECTPGGAPLLFFEGTYCTTFSGNKQPTPRYDYNQVLYRLDLDDAALRPSW